MNWALHTEYFSREDEFIKKNMERIRWLETLHKSVRNSLVKREAHKPYKIKDRFGNWRDQVVDWYNEWTIYGTECEFKHLFLYGLSNTGKTDFVRYILGEPLVKIN